MQEFKLEKHKTTIILLSLITIIYGVFTLYTWMNTQSTDNAYVEADISKVSAEVNGVIAEIFVKNNSYVKLGQKIAQIKAGDFQLRLNKAESAELAAKKKIIIVNSKKKLSEIKQDQIEEKYNFAKENFDQAQKSYRRIQELNKDKFASISRLDKTRLAWQKAKNDLSQAKLELETSKENLNLLGTEELAAQDALNIAISDKKLAEQSMGDTEIKSPISGILGNSSLKIGNYVVAGAPIFSVIPLESIYIKANFKETQLEKIKNGMEVAISFDSFPNNKIKGVVRNFAPATNSKFSILPSTNATGNFTKIVQRVPVLIDFKLPNELKDKILPGMSALVKIRTNQSIRK